MTKDQLMDLLSNEAHRLYDKKTFNDFFDGHFSLHELLCEMVEVIKLCNERTVTDDLTTEELKHYSAIIYLRTRDMLKKIEDRFGKPTDAEEGGE